jgi:integrase
VLLFRRIVIGQTSRRAKGEGTWETLPSGKIRLVKQAGGKTLKGPAAAGKIAARNEWEKKWGSKKGAGPVSLSQFAKTWMENQKGSPSTMEQLRIFISSKIDRDPIGLLSLGSIGDDSVRAWLRRQTQEPPTVRRNLGRLKQILKAAGIQCNVTKPADPGHGRRPLSPRERECLPKVLEQAPDEPTRRAIQVAIYTGLRRSEIIALRHEDRDGDGIWVRRRAIATKGRLDVQAATKSARSRRWVPIPPQLDWIGNGKGFVLTDSLQPVSPHVLTKGFRKAIEGTVLAGLPYLGFHALRRTYLMMLMEEGADVVTAAAIGGHDPVMLMQVYLKSREDLKVAAVERAFGAHSTQETTHEEAG